MDEHVFLGEGHTHAERRTWIVIWLSASMMVLEVVGGHLFGSIALVADGLHMSSHAGAMLIAALAYGFARRHAADRRFSFGTGKLGDLAGFTSALILGVIAVLIGTEAIGRLFAPIAIQFSQAIPIACLGLSVNILSAWLLSGGHDHAHDHTHARTHATHRDNNMRAILLHIMTDAAVTVLVIAGLLLARAFGWLWMDPAAGLVGACVIAVWSVRLMRATGAVLLDMVPDRAIRDEIVDRIAALGDRLTDLHLWRLGPGHLAAIVAVQTESDHDVAFYRALLAQFPSVSHCTVQIERLASH